MPTPRHKASHNPIPTSLFPPRPQHNIFMRQDVVPLINKQTNKQHVNPYGMPVCVYVYTSRSLRCNVTCGLAVKALRLRRYGPVRIPTSAIFYIF